MRYLGNKDTIVGGRHVPVSGTEAKRAPRAAKILANEIHTTSDQRRLFMQNVLLSGGVWHGEVADEAAMLALDSSSSRGCWPLDMCERADTETLWVCVSNRGGLLTDWREFPAAGIENPMTTAGDLIVGGTDGAPTRLAKGADGKVLKMVSGAVTWADESGGGGGGGDFTGCRLRRTSGQTVGSPRTACEWDAVDYDTDGLWSSGAPSRITAAVGGKYLFTAAVAGPSYVYFFRNGGPPLRGTSGPTSYHSISTVMELDAGDYVELMMQGADLNTPGDDEWHLSCTRLDS